MARRMAPGSYEIKVKNSNIKKLFESMEYGDISENANIAKAWLNDNEDRKGTVPQDLKSFMLDLQVQCEWSKKSPLEKCFAIERFAKEIERNSSLICQLEMLLRGILGNDTKTKSLPLLIEYLQYYVQYPISTSKGTTLIVIDDYCFLGMLGSALGPALACGYKVIMYTEPKVAVIVSLLMQLAENAGVPKETFSHVTGEVDLEIMFEHVDVISFPGNLHLSKFREVSIKYYKKIIGVAKGKTPMIVFNTADLDSACNSVVDAAWGYGANLPWSLNTILVQEDVFEAFVSKLKDQLVKVKMGTAFDQLADVAYPLSDCALQKLQKTLLTAKMCGIEIFQKDSSSELFQPTILIGGKVYVNNVILEDVDSMVVSVVPFRTTNEAVNLANNNRSGIGASVWTENIGLANEIFEKLNISNIWINTFGNISASVSFTPYKDSGVGFIGGQEGLCEYQYYARPCVSINKPVAKINAKGELMQSFYGGLFKKSESGMYDGIFEVSIPKDLFNAIAAAQKGFQLWKGEIPLKKHQLLRQLALEIDRKKTFLSENAGVAEKVLNTWIELTYQAFPYLSKTGNTSHNKLMSVQSVAEPLGVIAIHEAHLIEDSFMCIIISLLLGNTVIVLNFNKNFAKFYVELCKLLSLLKFPVGVFNVLLNCNEDIVKSIAFHKELIAYFVLSNDPALILSETKIANFKYVCVPMNRWHDCLYATKIKNIWCNVGDSTV